MEEACQFQQGQAFKRAQQIQLMLKSKRQICVTVVQTAVLSYREIIFGGHSLLISPPVVIYAAIGDLFCPLLGKDSLVLSSPSHSRFSVLIKREIAGQTSKCARVSLY